MAKPKVLPATSSVVVPSTTVAVPKASPLTEGAASAAAFSIARKEYECRICRCRSSMRTSCGVCGRRNCMDEVLVATPITSLVGADGKPISPEVVKARGSLAQAIAEGAKIVRHRSGITKLDRVLGGGYVDKSAILIAGDPGAGKSTLLLQACVAFAGPAKAKKGQEPVVHRTLYCSGEEAFEQVGARAGRIDGALEKGEWIEFVSTRNVPEIMGAILDVKPHLTVIDSIQEVGDEALSGRFGGENQVANAIRSVMKCIRENGFGTAVFVCHVRKDGDIAGAKKGEHLVDVVMKLSLALREEEDEEEEDLPEDEKTIHDERYLEAYKNRYGAITERAVFTMTAKGLR